MEIFGCQKAEEQQIKEIKSAKIYQIKSNKKLPIPSINKSQRTKKFFCNKMISIDRQKKFLHNNNSDDSINFEDNQIYQAQKNSFIQHQNLAKELGKQDQTLSKLFKKQDSKEFKQNALQNKLQLIISRQSKGKNDNLKYCVNQGQSKFAYLNEIVNLKEIILNKGIEQNVQQQKQQQYCLYPDIMQNHLITDNTSSTGRIIKKFRSTQKLKKFEGIVIEMKGKLPKIKQEKIEQIQTVEDKPKEYIQSEKDENESIIIDSYIFE